MQQKSEYCSITMQQSVLTSQHQEHKILFLFAAAQRPPQ